MREGLRAEKAAGLVCVVGWGVVEMLLCPYFNVVVVSGAHPRYVRCVGREA